MAKQTRKVPQWAKDFVSRRQEHLEFDAEVKSAIGNMWPLWNELFLNDRYLLCRFSEGEIETIRAELGRRRHKTVSASLRKAREAGAFVLDSGISDKGPLSDLYLREFLLEPLSKQEMQQVVANYYGWKEWREDPWGDSQKFHDWLGKAGNNDTRAIWAINETLGGRSYLAYGTVLVLDQLDYSNMTEKELLTCVGVGAESFLWVKSYTGWHDFEHHYPEEPLPAGLVNQAIIKGLSFSSLFFPSFNSYRVFVSSIYLWLLALKEAGRRAKDHPELAAFLNYHAATDAGLAELCQKLAPKGYRIPGQEQTWRKLEQALDKRLKAKATKYADIYPLRSGHYGTLKESYVTAQESLFEGVHYWKSKPGEALIAGLKGQLGNSLLSIIEHDFADDAKRAYRKHEITESQIEATRVTDEEDAPPFLDTIPSQEFTPEEPIDLESLGLDVNNLTPKEIAFVNELNDMVSKGYSRDSKQGLSFRQYWGKDYDHKIKMLQRLKAKRQKL